MLLKFSEPIQEISATMFYPIRRGAGKSSWLSMHAIRDDSSFIGGTSVFKGLAFGTFAQAHGARLTVGSDEPFTYVAIMSPLRAPSSFPTGYYRQLSVT